jgi:hypothetical protein
MFNPFDKAWRRCFFANEEEKHIQGIEQHLREADEMVKLLRLVRANRLLKEESENDPQ